MNPSSKHNKTLAGFEEGLLRRPEMKHYQTTLEELDREMEERLPVGNHDELNEVEQLHYSVWRYILLGVVALLLMAVFVLVAIRPERLLRRQELAALSNADHGATLDEFMMNVRGEGEVCYALFDDDGNKLFEYMEDYYGFSMYERPDWPDAEKFFSLVESAEVSTEVHWHPGLIPTSFGEDVYVSAQINSKQLIIIEYDKIHYFTPGSNGWPEVAEMLNFRRWNMRNPFSIVPGRDYFGEMLENFSIQHKIVLVK